MKKLTAILLCVALLATMCVTFVSAEEELTPDYSTKSFWITHFNTYAEAAGCIFTEVDEGGAWGIHIAFAPIEGTNAYEIVEISNGVGVGTAVTLEVPEGGFVYAMEEGNDYDDLAAADPDNYGWMAGWGNYCNPGCRETMAMIQTWEVGDKFAFEGLDFEYGNAPTSTPGLLWYNDNEDGDDETYICTGTVTPFVTYDETEEVLENGDYAYGVAYGYTFDIDTINGSVKGEDIVMITDQDSYTSYANAWAITVHLKNVEGELYEVVSAQAGGGVKPAITMEENDIVLIVHSASSNPNDGYANWQSKVIALALQAGDKVQVTDTFAYVLRAGDVIASEDEGEDEGDEGEDEISLKDVFEAINADRINDGALDVILDGPESYKAGDKFTVTATVKNITAEGGLHMIEFALVYDFEQLKLLNGVLADQDNALDCITAIPEGFENLSNAEEGVVYVIVVTTADLAVVEDGDAVFFFEFEALEDASAETGAIVPNEAVFAATNIPMSDENPNGGMEEHAGNGSYIVIEYADDAGEGDEGGEEGGEVEPPKAGDATNAIVFAIVALVSVMGTAIVVKNRK